MSAMPHMVECFLCKGSFQFGPHIYDGKRILPWGMLVCDECHRGTRDGIVPANHRTWCHTFNRAGCRLDITRKAGLTGRLPKPLIGILPVIEQWRSLLLLLRSGRFLCWLMSVRFGRSRFASDDFKIKKSGLGFFRGLSVVPSLPRDGVIGADGVVLDQVGGAHDLVSQPQETRLLARDPFTTHGGYRPVRYSVTSQFCTPGARSFA